MAQRVFINVKKSLIGHTLCIALDSAIGF